MPFFARFFSLIILFNLVIIPGYSQNRTREKYINRYSDIAIREMKQFAIPASITLAQACLESADGNSRLAKEANNHFGIKCHDWQGEIFLHSDDAKDECFRKYKSAEESFRDHSVFLTTRERYKSLFSYNITDYKAWAHGLKKAGYATNPHYAHLLIKIIEDYSLFKYDLPSSQLSQGLSEHPAKISYSLQHYHFSLTRPVFTKNGISYIIAGHNDNYNALAAEYRLFKRELLNFNDLKKDEPIKDGTIVYLERKKREGEKGIIFYTVEEGETLYSISQKFAVRLKKLSKLNNLTKDEEIKQGEKIRLSKN